MFDDLIPIKIKAQVLLPRGLLGLLSDIFPGRLHPFMSSPVT